MLARALKCGTPHDVVGYVTRQFHDPKEYTPDTWRIIDSEGIYTASYQKMVQSFEAIHGFMPEKENAAGHISISFDTADAPRLTDRFMAQLAREYLDGMGIKDTQFMVVRHMETGHPHFHIVYNRVNMQGRAVNERNNYVRSDHVVKALKDKYGLTYSPLKGKYEERIPEFRIKIRAAIYGCRSWDEFCRRMACAGIEVKFHKNRDTGETVGVKFTDGDITLTGSRIDRAFTYRRLNNLFKLNARQPLRPDVAVRPIAKSEPPQARNTVAEDIAEATVGAVGNLFQVGPGVDLQEEEFIREMNKKKKKRSFKPKF